MLGLVILLIILKPRVELRVEGCRKIVQTDSFRVLLVNLTNVEKLVEICCRVDLKVGGDICIARPWLDSSSKVSIVVVFIVLLNTSHAHIAILNLGAQTSVV